MSGAITKKRALVQLGEARHRVGETYRLNVEGDCDWHVKAVRVNHRGRTGPAWTWGYTVTHYQYHPHGTSFGSADETARCIAGLGHWAAMRARVDGALVAS